MIDTHDLAIASDGFTCDGCGRAELDCSVSPCADVLDDRDEGQRYTVEANGVHGWYVADNDARMMSSGSYRTQGEAAYECDVMRRPLHHDGTARRLWSQLGDAVRDNWNRNPTPRDWN